MFIRVYRLEIQSVRLAFRPSFVNCYPSNLLSALTPPFHMVLGLRHINTCRKVPLQVNFFRWQNFALPSMSLILLRFLPFSFGDQQVETFAELHRKDHSLHKTDLLRGRRVLLLLTVAICTVCTVIFSPPAPPQSRQSAKPFLLSSELGLPQPLTRRRVCPPPPLGFRGEGHTRWQEMGWESPNSDEGT